MSPVAIAIIVLLLAAVLAAERFRWRFYDAMQNRPAAAVTPADGEGRHCPACGTGTLEGVVEVRGAQATAARLYWFRKLDDGTFKNAALMEENQSRQAWACDSCGMVSIDVHTPPPAS